MTSNSRSQIWRWRWNGNELEVELIYFDNHETRGAINQMLGLCKDNFDFFFGGIQVTKDFRNLLKTQF